MPGGIDFVLPRLLLVQPNDQSGADFFEKPPLQSDYSKAWKQAASARIPAPGLPQSWPDAARARTLTMR